MGSNPATPTDQRPARRSGRTLGSVTTSIPLLPDSIETYLATSVPTCSPEDSASLVRGALRRRTFDTVADVAVLADGRLVGLIPAERLVAADDDAVAADLMDADPPVVAPGAVAVRRPGWIGGCRVPRRRFRGRARP